MSLENKLIKVIDSFSKKPQDYFYKLTKLIYKNTDYTKKAIELIDSKGMLKDYESMLSKSFSEYERIDLENAKTAGFIIGILGGLSSLIGLGQFTSNKIYAEGELDKATCNITAAGLMIPLSIPVFGLLAILGSGLGVTIADKLNERNHDIKETLYNISHEVFNYKAKKEAKIK